MGCNDSVGLLGKHHFWNLKRFKKWFFFFPFFLFCSCKLGSVAIPGIFLMVVLTKHKLHNLIKKRNSYIDNNNNKKNTQIHKVYNCILQVFIFWNRCMIVLLSMLQATSLSIYTTKQSFIHWSPIQLHSSFFIYFIAEKLFSTIAVKTGRVKSNFTSK